MSNSFTSLGQDNASIQKLSHKIKGVNNEEIAKKEKSKQELYKGNNSQGGDNACHEVTANVACCEATVASSEANKEVDRRNAIGIIESTNENAEQVKQALEHINTSSERERDDDRSEPSFEEIEQTDQE